MSVQQVLSDAAAPVVPLHRRVTGRQVLVALFVSLLLLGALLLLLRPAPAPTTAAAPLDPASPLTPTTLEAPAMAPLPEPAAPTREMLFDERLSRIDLRMDALDASLERIGAQIDQLSGELTRLDAADASLGERISTLKRPAQVAVHRPRAPRPRPAAPRPRPAAPALPTLVSVDLWGGRPSAAIRGVDGKVRFYAEGDTVGVARLRSISASARTVVIEHRNGKTSTLTVGD